MFLNLGQRTQAQVWLDVQFSDFRMLAGMRSLLANINVSCPFSKWDKVYFYAQVMCL